MNNDAILASISKIHAYRYAKEKQRGVKLGENQVTTIATKFVTAPIQIGTEDFSVEFYGNSFGSDAVTGYSFMRYLSGSLSSGNAFNLLSAKGENGISVFQFGDTNLSPIIYSDPDLNGLFHLVVTRSGVNVKVVVNGSTIGEYSTTQICNFGTMDFLVANSRNVGFVRVWNYALSAEEITTLYNNGDPMGYVVPKMMRDLEPVEITGGNSYTWTGIDSISNFGIVTNPNIEYGKFYVLNISVSDYEAGKPYLYIGYSYAIPTANGNYNIIIKHQNSTSNTILLFGGTYGTDRRLTLTINSITPVGLIAEYLPQNLVGSPTDKTIATTWLDSAKQLPWSDAYLPPLLQSKGGYDMVANGAPEILFKDPIVVIKDFNNDFNNDFLIK